MKMRVRLLCEGDDCTMSENEMPTGEFEDMRIGKAVLLRQAQEDGWKIVQPGGRMPDGAFNRRQVRTFCQRCVQEKRGLAK